MFASNGVRPAFLRLHVEHAATTFSHVCGPFWMRGMTWSKVSSDVFSVQYDTYIDLSKIFLSLRFYVESMVV